MFITPEGIKELEEDFALQFKGRDNILERDREDFDVANSNIVQCHSNNQ